MTTFMSEKIIKYTIFTSILLVFSISFIFVYSSSVKSNGGNFVYPLDDTYIHLSVARNWAEYGLPGVNPSEFSFLSSSPLWTSLLSAFAVVGIDIEMLPLYLNFIISLILIFYLTNLFYNKIKNKFILFFLILILIFSASFLIFTFIGLEHLLHVFLLLLFFIEISKLESSNRESSVFLIYFLAFILPLVRYESLFAIFAAAVWFTKSKDYIKAILIFILAAMSVSMVGIFSIIYGGTFLPSSLMLKGEFLSHTGFYEILKSLLWHPIKKMIHAPVLAVLLGISITFLYHAKKHNFKNEFKSLLFIFILTTVLHLLFAQIGWLYRYEAYLILIGLVVNLLYFIKLISSKQIKINKTIIGLSLLLLLSLGFRAYNTNTSINKASTNIYEQQYQTAKFLSHFYAGDKIAVNDIGLVSWKGNVYVYDLWGLATPEILSLKRQNKINGKVLDQLMVKNGVHIAAIYKEWFEFRDGFYKNWYEAGSWTIKNNYICGSTEVSFFAKDSAHLVKLEKDLLEFSSYLPKGVIQKLNIGH